MRTGSSVSIVKSEQPTISKANQQIQYYNTKNTLEYHSVFNAILNQVID